MDYKNLTETPTTPDAEKEKVTSVSSNVKVTLSDSSTNLIKQEAVLLYHYGLLMYNFCS